MADTHYPSHWREKLCAALSINGWRTGVFPHQVMRFFSAWGRAEGGTATWNPLNTTQTVTSDDFGNWASEPDYNDIGVKNYKTPALGLMATIVTILAPKYSKLLDGLRGAETNAVTAEQLVETYRHELSLWGTNPDLMLKLLKEIT